jgi:polar amino acid transport system permease protein
MPRAHSACRAACASASSCFPKSLPQITRAALPALVNEMTLLIKVSPAVAVIGVTEVTRAAVRIGATTYNPIPPFLVALAIYVVVIGIFVAAQRMLERRHRAGRLA